VWVAHHPSLPFLIPDTLPLSVLFPHSPAILGESQPSCSSLDPGCGNEQIFKFYIAVSFSAILENEKKLLELDFVMTKLINYLN